MKLIETYIHDDVGYNPYLINDGWQVAKLNYQQSNGVNDIVKLDIHHQTDEVFVLLSGDAVLIAGSINMHSVQFETVKMKVGATYNIPAGCWHNIAMCKNAEIVIIEKNDTHKGDFGYHYLSREQCAELYTRIAQELQAHN